MDILLATCYAIISLSYLIFRARGNWLLNPAAIFVIIQSLMFAGTLPLLDMGLEADRMHLTIMFIAQVLFIAGVLLAEKLIPIRNFIQWEDQPIQVEKGQLFEWVVLGLAIFSATMMLLYYDMVGYNVFLLSLSSYAQAGQGLSDAAELRRDSYATEAYFAPGYFNQFKNVILPMLAVFCLIRYKLTNRRLDGVIAVCLLPLAIVGLLGTGQRGAFGDFVFTSWIFGTAALPLVEKRKFQMSIGAIGLLLLILGTIFLGRSTGGAGGILEQFTLALKELWERLFWGNQASSVAGFQLIYDKPVQMGRDWLAELSAILPASVRPLEEPTLTVDIFEHLYNSRGGTAPHSLWGGVWHNFGMLGCVVVPFVLGIIYQCIYAGLYKGPKTLMRLLIYSGLSAILGSWISAGPLALANKGLITWLILAILTYRLIPRKRRAFLRPTSSPYSHQNRTLSQGATRNFQ